MYHIMHLLVQMLLYVLSFYFAVPVKTVRQYTESGTVGYVICLILLWTFLLWLTNTHKPKFYQRKIKYVIAPFIKSAIFLLVVNYALLLLWGMNTQIKQASQNAHYIYIFSLMAVYSLWTILVRHRYKNTSISEKFKENGNLQAKLSFNTEKVPDFIDLKELPDLLYFCSEKINLFFQEKEGSKGSVARLFKLGTNHSDLQGKEAVYIVDSKLNDFKDINAVMGSVYDSLIPGGHALFVYEELESFERRFLNHSNSIVLLVKKLYYYLCFRAIPKIPLLSVIYNNITGGKGKVISKAEVWGRLYYQGFEVKNQIEIEGLSYILARKENEPSTNSKPSFYPVIKLNRVGLYGKIIKIHKIRSMYPYSEFLQKKVYDENKLNSTGKFTEDYRVTKPGKIFRKYWIDELPQILDWFRGEIKLVGIRALSQHFFGLYPKEYQDIFVQVKPGIVSPIFDENTDGFQEIVKIEMEYLKSYMNHPVLTDCKYFFATFRQIISGVRSK